MADDTTNTTNRNESTTAAASPIREDEVIIYEGQIPEGQSPESVATPVEGNIMQMTQEELRALMDSTSTNPIRITPINPQVSNAPRVRN